MKCKIDPKVKCDKPYDLDAQDRRAGRPRRQRKDPRTTAYMLTIRLSEEQRSVLGKAKPKLTRNVYARNKRDDLAAQTREFEEDVERRIREAASVAGLTTNDERLTVDALMGMYLTSKPFSKDYVRDTLNVHERYINPEIGQITFDELTMQEVVEMLENIPRRSLELNKRIRAERERGRAEGRGNEEPFKEIQVAGLPTQHKTLSLLKRIGNYGLEMELVTRNIANNRRLAMQYPKSKPKIDPWTGGESRLIYQYIESMPLGAAKVELTLLFLTGMRPKELRALTFGNVVEGAGKQSNLRITDSKTINGIRTIPLDPSTSSLLAAWRRDREAFAKDHGLVFDESWLLCAKLGDKAPKSTLKKRWETALDRVGLERRRVYSTRHTFATWGATSTDMKTLSGLMGHASPSTTLAVYAGYSPQAAQPVTTNYRNFLTESNDGEREPQEDGAPR